MRYITVLADLPEYFVNGNALALSMTNRCHIITAKIAATLRHNYSRQVYDLIVQRNLSTEREASPFVTLSEIRG